MHKTFNTDNISELYTKKILDFGSTPEGLAQGAGGKPLIRYKAMADCILRDPHSSLLDVGCGFGGLLSYLREAGWKGDYTGIDITEKAITIAQAAHPYAKFIKGDISLYADQKALFDYVICIGGFTLKLASGDSDAYYLKCMKTMFDVSKKACMLALLSTYVDYQKEVAWHAEPTQWYRHAMSLTRCVTLDHSFLPYEFSLTLRHAAIDTENRYIF